ncbi:MAG: class II aldolase/adducin family protein [Halioglobus sp.]|nr:class II aldolase/adducin family protein [Halioglobus sp.]
MNKPWLMGIDLGGGGARCILANRLSGARVSAQSAWSFPPAEGTFGTGYNVDLDTVWGIVGTACQDAAQKARLDPAAVAGIAVSAMRFATVALNANGGPVLCLDNRDARAAGEYFEVAEKLGQQLLEETGCWPLPLHASARLLWLRNQQPDAFKTVETLFGIGDWLNFKLCGARAIDPTQASATGLFHLTERDWCWSAIDALQLPRNIFPPVIDAGSSIGKLSAEAAADIGLEAGVTVGMGGGDTQCSLLGAGVIRAGETAVVAGTTAPVQTVLAQPTYDLKGKSLGSYHIVPDRWVLESNGGGMGFSFSLMARVLFPDAPEPELRLLAEAARSEPGAAGMLSTLGADVTNMRSPSMPVGHITMSHIGGQDDPDPRRHLARALIEGCACGVRANLEQLDSVLGKTDAVADKAALTLCGGMSRSDVFAQILANIVAREVSLPASHETAALGAALCGGVAGGTFANFSAACDALSTPRGQFNPEHRLHEVNQQLYDTWFRYREQAENHTSPIGIEHLMPRVLKEPQATRELVSGAAHLEALVAASFDDQSLKRLGAHMTVEYASFREMKRLLTGAELVKALQGKQVFVTEVDILDANALQQLPDLRVVAACRGDAVNVDVDACTAFGIPVLFAPGRNAVAVADLAVALMINLARKLPKATQFLQQQDCTAGNMGKMGQAFSQFQGNELWHKTVGLIGLGAVGKAVAQRLAGFDVELLVADPFITAEQAALAGCRLTDLDTLLAKSDVISLHAAVTAQTSGMIGAEQFARMKQGAFFINTARAALIDEQALINALETGAIAGAGLDTFAVEPPGFDHPLVQHPAVISTPHCAGNTVEVANHQGESITTALLQLLQGGSPRNVLNPEVLKTFDWQSVKPQPDETELTRLLKKSGPAVSDLQRDTKTVKHKKMPERSTAETGAPKAVIDTMRIILEKFCADMAADPSLNAFTVQQDVTLQFNVHDLGLQFYLSLRQDKVLSAIGPPDDPADVQLAMRGEIIDGMFTGTIDPMESAMNGELSFVGDAGKAMTLQEIQHDMERIYTAARTATGDPGDLSSIGTASGDAIFETVATGDVREELLDVLQELFDSQVITATGGNISARIPETDEEIWITPSRVFKGSLTTDMMVRIGLDGGSLTPGARSPSSEWCMHTAVLARKPEANAVIHAHAPNATILANSGLDFLPISTEAAFFGNIPRIPFMLPGTAALAEAVAAAMANEWACLLVNHGLVVAGRDLRRAADMVEIIERSAEIMLGCYAVGKEPPVLPPDAVEHFRKIGDIVA